MAVEAIEIVGIKPIGCQVKQQITLEDVHGKKWHETKILKKTPWNS